MRQLLTLFAALVVSLTAFAGIAAAQAKIPADLYKDKYKFALPQDPQLWLNGGPLSFDALEGKGVVTVLMAESEFPSCKWLDNELPGALTTAKEYAEQPVLFVVVAYGSKQAVAEYAQRTNITWPIVVLDPSIPTWVNESADFAKLLTPNGLMFSTRAVTKSGEGHFWPGHFSAFEDAVKRALINARWKVDPAGMPAALRPTWAALEYGNYAAAAPGIKRGLASKQPDIRAASEQLQASVHKMIAARQEQATALKEQDKTWEAYKQVVAIQLTFAAFEPPATLAALAKEWESDAEVSRQLAGQKQLEAATKILSARSPTARRRGLTQLRTIVAKHGDTEAAAQASNLLAQVEGTK